MQAFFAQIFAEAWFLMPRMALFSVSRAVALLVAVMLAQAVQASEPGPGSEASSHPRGAIEQGVAGNYLSSRFARQNGDADAAIRYLTKTIEKNPGDADLYAQMLGLQMGKGKIEEALVIAQKLRAAGGHEPLADLLVTLSEIKPENYPAAALELNRSFEDSSSQLWLPLMEAWMDAAQGRLKKPLTVEEMPITVGRAASVMSYHLALINAYAGFSDQAMQNFVDAVESPESAAPRMMQYLQAFSAEHGKPEALESLLRAYVVANGPIAVLDAGLRTPADGVAEVLYTMGNVMQVAGVGGDAAVYMQLVRYLRPEFHAATFSLVEILTDGKEYARAIALLEQIPASHHYALKATLRRAMLLERMEKHQEAMNLLAQLAQQEPKLPDPWIAKGDVLRMQKRFLEALSAYTEAMERMPGADSSRWVVFYARGACLERLQRWKEAKLDLQRALELRPDQPDVLNYLGYGMLTRGESVEQAREMLETALSLSPNDPQILDSMGWALHLSGQYAESLPYLERALELLPGDATVNDHLGDNYWRLGRRMEARFQWERALDLSINEPEAPVIQKKLLQGLPEAVPHATQSAAVKTPDPSATLP